MKRHEKFVKALEKDFDITVHHFEPVNEGVFVFMDEESNNKLGDELSTNVDLFDKLTDEHGYILIRRGTPEDIKWGSFPNGLAKWMFVYSPTDSENWTDSLDDMEAEILSQAEKLKSKEPKKKAEPGRDVRAESSEAEDAYAVAQHLSDEDEMVIPECPACGGGGTILGSLGARKHYRCRQCGMQYSNE